jgi:hypothetical protein
MKRAVLAAALVLLAESARAATVQSAVVRNAVTFSPFDDEATVAASGAPSVSIGDLTVYIGYRQVSADNQDPVVRAFSASDPAGGYVRTDYETSGDDGRGFGLLTDGVSLYALFSATGTQGAPATDYRRFTAGGWLPSYGSGGGARVSVLARLDPATGEPIEGTFVSAILASGNANTLVGTGLDYRTLPGGETAILVEGDSFFSPRGLDGQALDDAGATGSPFAYRLLLTPDLTTALAAEAGGWVREGVAIPAPGVIPLPPSATLLLAALGGVVVLRQRG